MRHIAETKNPPERSGGFWHQVRLGLVRPRFTLSARRQHRLDLLDAQSQQGGAYKRKDDIFRMAQANKAFAHYRW